MSVENLNQTAAETKKPDTDSNMQVDTQDLDSRVEPAGVDAVDFDAMGNNISDATVDLDTRVDPSEVVTDDGLEQASFDPDSRVDISETEADNVSLQEPTEQPAQSEVDDEADVPSESPYEEEATDQTLDDTTDPESFVGPEYDESKTLQDEIVDKKNNEKEPTENEVTTEEADSEQVGESETETNEIDGTLKEYLNELKEISPVPDTIDADKVLDIKVKDVSPNEVAMKRSEFSDLKKDLKLQWEKLHNCEWPKYSEDVYSDSGKLLRRKGDDLDAHHIQPLSKGGENTVENITPLHVNDHYDKKGVHASGSPCSNLS